MDEALRFSMAHGLLTAFERVGGIWAASDQTQQGLVLQGRPCLRGFPRCSRPEDLYLDDKPLHHVDRMYDVAPGKWYFDYATHKVYLGDDPAGKEGGDRGHGAGLRRQGVQRRRPQPYGREVRDANLGNRFRSTATLG